MGYRGEGDARARRRGLGTPCREPGAAPRAGLLACRVGETGGEADGGQVRVTFGQPVQQVQAAVDQVEGLVSAPAEDLPGGNVQLGQAQPAARRGRPGQEALRVHPGIEPTARQQEPEEPAQVEGGDVGVGQDRRRRGRGRRLPGRQEHARLAGAGHVEMVPGPGAGHEQDAAFPLQVLGVRDGVLAFRGDRRRVAGPGPARRR